MGTKSVSGKDSSILVTGATGFVGRHLCQYLVSEHMRVSGISRRSVSIPGVDMNCIDINDHTAVSTLFEEKEFEIVIHLASHYPPKGQPLDSLSAMYHDNTTPIFHLLSSMKPGTRFVYASALSVCNGGNWDRAVTENDIHPGDAYSASKLAGETITEILCRRRDLSHITLRFSSIYGPGDSHPDVVVPLLIRRAANGEQLTVYGKGDRVMDLVYIDDVIHATNLAAFSSYQGVYNIGSGTGTKIKDLIYRIAEIFGTGASQVQHQHIEQEDLLYLVADITRARQDLGYSPRFQLVRGLHRYKDCIDERTGVVL